MRTSSAPHASNVDHGDADPRPVPSSLVGVVSFSAAPKRAEAVKVRRGESARRAARAKVLSSIVEYAIKY